MQQQQQHNRLALVVALVLMMSSLLHILLPLTLLQYKQLLIPYKQYVLQGTRCP